MKRMTIDTNHILTLTDGNNTISLTEKEVQQVIRTYNKTLTAESLRQLEEKRIARTGILNEMSLDSKET